MHRCTLLQILVPKSLQLAVGSVQRSLDLELGILNLSGNMPDKLALPSFEFLDALELKYNLWLGDFHIQGVIVNVNEEILLYVVITVFIHVASFIPGLFDHGLTMRYQFNTT